MNTLAGYELELMCIRGVAQQAALSTPLYAWLHQVVESACNERRNVRVCLSMLSISIVIDENFF